jgi:hypothetical protein
MNTKRIVVSTITFLAFPTVLVASQMQTPISDKASESAAETPSVSTPGCNPSSIFLTGSKLSPSVQSRIRKNFWFHKFRATFAT